MKEQPNRWLHLRYKDGFTPEMYECFKAHCKIYKAYVRKAIEVAKDMPNLIASGVELGSKYVFFELELSDDRKVCIFLLGGIYTLGFCYEFEHTASHILWVYFTEEILSKLELGLTEENENGMETTWESPPYFILLRNDPEILKRLLGE